MKDIIGTGFEDFLAAFTVLRILYEQFNALIQLFATLELVRLEYILKIFIEIESKRLCCKL